MRQEIAKPLAQSIANLLEPSWINKQYENYIAGSNVYTVIGTLGFMYFKQVSDAIKLRREQVALQRQQGMMPPTVDQQRQQQAAQGNGHQPQHIGANMPFSGNTKSGIPWMGGQS